MKFVTHLRILTLTALMTGGTAYAADYLAEGHQAFLDYDFELASELYGKYAKTLAKKPDAEGESFLRKFQRQLEIAENSLDNVQKVEIIDRIDVPIQDFLSAIEIPDASNRLLDTNSIPFKERYNSSDYLFSTQNGDLVMWTELDTDGNSHLYESHRLVDGSWELPQEDDTSFSDDGNLKNPFMLSDGITVYFAGDGEDSMGGYDLFVATKDPSTGEFRQPMAVGYPFNSPFNEYMMAIDEENGIGWWVTDRNQLDGEVSVYVFYTNDVRKNYNADEEDDIIALARVDDISITQNPDKDYDSIMQEITQRSKVSTNDSEANVIFRLPGGKVIRQVSDLKSAAAKRNLSQYLSAKAEYDSNCQTLAALRKKYHNAKANKGASEALKNQILDLEKTLEWQRDKLKKMSNSVISAESKTNR